MSDLDDDDKMFWSIIFQAAVAITNNEETTKQAMSPTDCKAVVDGLCTARAISFSDRQVKAAHITVQAIRGSSIVKELAHRWREQGQPSFTTSDVQRASETLQHVASDFMRRRK